ncbi:sensor histidine kinase [Henriciella pelagia]|jgi:two-component system, OmpR family, osmolarity sensor histidine kinase EnvZ|uniref:histidine kinase n=1 Tax=Henriciella pelagia TaxID=1977912 RepID=A0ABQ1JY58_9PROT|nr:ATP-binding protein [Henriciella pelagia]GGB78317.1 two-component sensor histidine kinase [Henriciella pelagia]
MPKRFHIRLRDITPRGLYPRSVLMVVLPMILLLSAVTYIFYDSHWRHTSRKLSQTISSEIQFMVELRRQYPDQFDALRDEASRSMQLDATVLENSRIPTEQKRLFFSALDDIFSRELDVSLDQPFWFDISGYGEKVEIQVQDGPDVIRFMAERDRTFSTTGHIFIVWVIGASGILIALALGFLRNQVRSILKLTEAAKAYGRGRDADNYRPSGATEIRDAARAVMDMRTRLTTFAEQRTTMLAGISHDLRTPLTRLKLQLAMMEETDDIRAAREDLRQMGAMLDEYLAFASGVEGEAPTEMRFDTLVADTVAALGGQATIRKADAVSIIAREGLIRRAVTNLISNAQGFGDRVEIDIIEGPHMAELVIDDDGPGIPPDEREEAFRPFHRLDASRNQNVPGTGLGLSIARDTARQHGGDIRLEDSPLGGLRVRLRLPI